MQGKDSGGETKRWKIVCIGDPRTSARSEVLRRFLRNSPTIRQKLFTAAGTPAPASTAGAPTPASTTAAPIPSPLSLPLPTGSSDGAIGTVPSNITLTTDGHKNIVFEGELAAAEGSTKPVPVPIEVVDAAPEESNRIFAYPRADLFLIFFSLDDHDAQKHLLTRWIPEISQHCPGTPYGLVCTGTLLRTPRTAFMTQVQGKELAKRLKCHRYWELGFGLTRRRGATIATQSSQQSLQDGDTGLSVEETKDDKVLDEEIRMLFSEAAASVAFPPSKEAKDLGKRRKMMDKVQNEVSTAVSEGKTEITFRKRGLDNTHIPKNMGKYMKEVKKLVLSDNKLFFFPMAILDMVNLHTLEMKNNQLTYLPKEITRLSNLKKLDIENNQLTSLPGEMGSMTHLEELKLKGNFLDGFLPPEALANQTRGILAYLRDLHKGAERCYRMKLMFVGKEAAGKSSLSYYLMNNKKIDKAPLSTDGIDIHNWDIPVTDFSTEFADIADKLMKDNWGNKPVTFAVWDFAGQEVYYSTHQFYLSRRSLYLCVFDLTDPDITSGNFSRVSYWLQSINAKAKGAPIICVGTKQDLCSPSQVNEIFLKMQDQFASFGVKEFMPVSCISGKGIKELKMVIMKAALKQRTMGEQIPKFYLELERMVERKRVELATLKKPPTVYFEEFRVMAMNIPQLEDEEELIRAMEFLNELGSLVYFRKAGLSDIVILDPRWLTEVMATVVSSKTMLEKGILQHKFLFNHIWKGDQYPSYLHPHLLLLLEKFQITFRLRRKRIVLRAVEDITGRTQNQLSFKVGDKILLLEKPKVGRWWKGIHNGQTGYFQANHVEDAGLPPEFTLENESLVPCLLTPDPPAGLLEKEWPAVDEAAPLQIGRIWKFNFLPLPFFPQVIVRLLHTGESRLHWKHGMVVESLRGDAWSLVQVNHDQGTLAVYVRSADPTALQDMISSVEEEVDILRDWFGVTFTEIKVPCSHCLKERKKDPYLFTLDECELASAEDRKVLVCQSNVLKGVQIPLVEIVPDIAMAQYKKVAFSQIEMGTMIGQGAYADVYKATYEGKTVAVKKLNNAKGFKEFRAEVKFMSVVDHPNIVLLRGICLNPPCIITEFMDLGDLHSFLDNTNNKLTWQQSLKIAEDVAKGMNFLHSQSPPRIHRDLKSPNVLLGTDSQGQIVAKVADFGTARSLAPTIAGRTVDNPIWLAPEVMRNEEYTEKADVYSYGIILYEIYTRKFPFGKKTRFQIELEVVEGKRPDLPDDCPPFFMDLTTACWSDSPTSRPAFSTVLDKLKTAPPITYRALAPFSVETPISARVDVGDVIYLEADKKKPISSGDVRSIKCIHHAQTIVLPSDFLQNNCECIAFEDYYYNTYQLLQTPQIVEPRSSSVSASSPLSSTASPISSLSSSTDGGASSKGIPMLSLTPSPLLPSTSVTLPPPLILPPPSASQLDMGLIFGALSPKDPRDTRSVTLSMSAPTARRSDAKDRSLTVGPSSQSSSTLKSPKEKSRSSSFRLLKNLQKDKKVDDKDRERELKEEQDDESRRLATEEVSEEAIIAEYGFHRVLDGNEGEEKTILPHYAKRLDNNPTLQNPYEILISVQLLFLPERNLVVSLKKQGGDDLAKGVIKSLAEAGKIYAPPGEDVKDRGWIVGTVQQVGNALQGKLDMKEGDRVIPVYSISSIPLNITSVDGIIGEKFLSVKGTAVAFARSSFVTLPAEFDADVASVVVDVASSLSQIERASSASSVVVIGLGKVGLAALCYLRKVTPMAKIIAFDKDDANLDAARLLKKADIVQKINARNTAEVLTLVRRATQGGADFVLHCTRSVGLEAAAILSAKKGGSVLFCRQNADPNRVALLAPSNDVSLLTSGGSTSNAHAQRVFELVRTEPELRKVITAFARSSSAK